MMVEIVKAKKWQLMFADPLFQMQVAFSLCEECKT